MSALFGLATLVAAVAAAWAWMAGGGGGGGHSSRSHWWIPDQVVAAAVAATLEWTVVPTNDWTRLQAMKTGEDGPYQARHTNPEPMPKLQSSQPNLFSTRKHMASS